MGLKNEGEMGGTHRLLRHPSKCRIPTYPQTEKSICTIYSFISI